MRHPAAAAGRDASTERSGDVEQGADRRPRATAALGGRGNGRGPGGYPAPVARWQAERSVEVRSSRDRTAQVGTARLRAARFRAARGRSAKMRSAEIRAALAHIDRARAAHRPGACPEGGALRSESFDPRLHCAADEINDGDTCSFVSARAHACTHQDLSLERHPCGLALSDVHHKIEPTPQPILAASALVLPDPGCGRRAPRTVPGAFSPICAKAPVGAGGARRLL